jgi:two-component system sensor histidine kinase HydH
LLNLLKNSINATSSGGEISLSASEDAHHVRIIVSDNGIGMTGQEREKMFDPFFTTRKTGTGLGLAVSHQIIEQHSGTFEVKTAQGEGTTVTIVLPKTKEDK